MSKSIDGFGGGVDRRAVLVGGSAAAVTLVAGCAAARPVTRDPFLETIITIDTHAHPGSFWRKSGDVRGALERIKAGQLSAFTYSVPTDGPILTRDSATRRIVTERAPEPGELYRYARQNITDGLAKMADAGIPVAETLADIVDAKKAGTPAGILALEGGGFAADRLEAIEEMHGLGVRIVQPIHYNNYSPFGDIQGRSELGGLTADGRQFVQEMRRLGIVLDVAHMTMQGVSKAADAYAGPVILSHVFYLEMGMNTTTPRVALPDHAKIVADTGGLLGVWNLAPRRWVEYLGYTSRKDMFIGTFKMLADRYGVDHVCLGTDIGSTTGWFNTYDQLADLAKELRNAGFNDGEIAKMLGGNVLKLFGDITRKTASAIDRKSKTAGRSQLGDEEDQQRNDRGGPRRAAREADYLMSRIS